MLMRYYRPHLLVGIIVLEKSIYPSNSGLAWPPDVPMHLSGHTHLFSSQLSGDVIHEQLHTELVRPRGAQVEAGQEEDVPVRV